MKANLLNTAIALSLYTFPLSVAAASPDLDWMLGCWTSPDGSSREVWVRQSEQQLIGFSVALSNGRVGFHEALSIEGDDDGFHYTAHPQGQAMTTFSAPDTAGQTVSFSNAGHDYPQRISYQLHENELQATIALLDGSKPVSFNKVRCD